MHCENCGGSIANSDAKFCRHCGSPLDGSLGPAATDAKPRPPLVVPVVVMSVVAVVVLVSVLVWTASSREDSAQADEADDETADVEDSPVVTVTTTSPPVVTEAPVSPVDLNRLRESYLTAAQKATDAYSIQGELHVVAQALADAFSEYASLIGSLPWPVDMVDAALDVADAASRYASTQREISALFDPQAAAFFDNDRAVKLRDDSDTRSNDLRDAERRLNQAFNRG